MDTNINLPEMPKYTDRKLVEDGAQRRAPGGLATYRRHALEILRDHPELRQDQESYNINVTSNSGKILSQEELIAALSRHAGAGRPAHLYFHVPLCDYVCKFCNYVKRLASSKDRFEELEKWTTLLIEESNLYLDAFDWIRAARVESVYFGGGTASLLQPSHLQRLMEHVRARYDLAPNAEVSLEGNPDNFLESEAARAVELGFNRFSLGVQSLQDEVTAFSGRKHDARQSMQAIDRLLATGMPFNVDIMFGLPHQTRDSVAADVRKLVSIGVPTITIYRFRNVQRHKMGIGNKSAWNNARVIEEMKAERLFPALDTTYEMRERIVGVLLDEGYTPSPCGWWSRPGTYPEGNIPQVSKNKWEHFDTMIAYGPGAYGWLAGGASGVTQTHNISDIAAYLNHMSTPTLPPLAFGRQLMEREAVAAALGFAFKANQPIDPERFAREYGVDLLRDDPYRSVIRQLLANGFLVQCEDGHRVRPTLEGEAVHEEIISVYFHGALGGQPDAICRK